MTAAGEERSQAAASGLLGLVMIVLGVVVLVDAARLRGSDDPVGPAAAPTVIGVLLGLLGGALVLSSRTLPRTSGKGLWRLTAMVVTLIAFALLLPLLGYVVSSAGLFTAAALLLGAPHPGRVVAYGWTLAAVVFLVLDRLIGLSLPAGPWGF
ncbi:tripartite tricarboxylate transporter TctB family protein [Actinoplanes sp. NPDC049596]|uniref:tripartite tricarboxylate transporter TctB family protein n=1 Tax=unclassified Actinoplanes TaxID=2626549 RepID=UPI0034203FB3